jgi:AraC-like DNA-binding protein
VIQLDIDNLKENKIHGTPLLPLAIYKETISPQIYEVSLHWHTGFEFVYIAEGKANFTINLNTYTVNKGDFLLVPPNALHAFTPLSNHKCTCKTIIFDLKFMESSMLDLVTTNYIAPIRDGNLCFRHQFNSQQTHYNAIHNCHSTIFTLLEEKPPHFSIKLKASLFELLAILFEAEIIINSPESGIDNSNIEALRRVMTYIYDNRTNPISIDQLASIAGYSKDYFIRFFKKHLDQTPVNYINHYRLNHARILLESQSFTITEIAHESGFNNVSYFIKLFKTQYGLTPKAYRKSIQ